MLSLGMNNKTYNGTWFLLIAATYGISRLLFHAMGVRFDASGLDWYWQYLDVELLKSDLLRSTFFQHSQPPLFNLFLGTILKLFPDAYALVFSLLYKALSLGLYYLLYRNFCLIRFKPWLAYLAATLFILSPGVVLYENWLFYTWPTAVALTFAVHQLLLFAINRRTCNALLYMASIAAICLIRSMFHFAYLIVAVIPVLCMSSRARKPTGLAAGAASLLVGGLFFKNLLLFGVFGSSSWMGMNLWKVVPTGGKSEQLAASAVARIDPFSPIAAYPEPLRQLPAAYTNLPALAAEFKQNGQPNLNHYGYIAVSEAYKHKAVELIRDDLPGYAGIVCKAWGCYMTPAVSYPLLLPSNVDALKGYATATAFANPRWLVPAGFVLMFVGIAGIFPRSGFKLRGEERAVLLFCAGTVLYIAILGNFMEYGENMRFRVQTDPLLYLAALLAASHLRARFQKRRKCRLELEKD